MKLLNEPSSRSRSRNLPLVAKLTECFSKNQMALDVEGIVDGALSG